MDDVAKSKRSLQGLVMPRGFNPALDPVAWNPDLHKYELVPNAAIPGFASIISTNPADYALEIPGALPTPGATNLAADAGHRHGGIPGVYTNRLVNGSLLVGQRGSGPFATNNVYTADRWQMAISAGTMSVTRVAGVDPDSIVALQSVITGASTALPNILTQKIEDFWFGHGKTVTFSARVISAVPNAVRLQLAASGYATTNSAYHTGDGTEQTLSVTVPLNNTYVALTCSVLHEAAGTFTVEKLWLGEGPITPPNVNLSAADEWMRCLRYYYKIGPASVSPFWEGYIDVGSDMSVWLPFPVPMALNPTLTVGGTFALIGLTSVRLDAGTTLGARLSGLGATGTGHFRINSNGSGFLTAEANP